MGLGTKVILAKLGLVIGGFALGWALQDDPIDPVRGMLLGEAVFFYGFLAALIKK